MIIFINNPFFCTNKKSSFKIFYLGLCLFSISSGARQSLSSYYYVKNSSKMLKKKYNLHFLLKKKMEFKVTDKSFVFKNKACTFFPKTNKVVSFFGLKYSKNTNATFSKKQQLEVQELNFTAKSLFSLNRDLGLNPYFGGVSRGFSKLLVKIHLKEYLNVFLRPKWYRLAKLQNFKSSILKKNKKTELFSHANTVYNYFDANNFYFFHNFFIKKRWFLLHLLNYGKKI